MTAPSAGLSAKIIDYRDLIARSTKGFVGRQWVRDAVDGFLAGDGPRSRYFLLLGEPGCGKTAFMADLVRTRGYAHHFVGKGSHLGVESSADWRDPVRFAESIGYQLLRDYGAWIMDWESWGIHVSQSVRELDGLLVGAELDRFDAAPRTLDRPAVSVDQEAERFGLAAQAIGVYIDKFVMDVEQIVHQLLTTPLRMIGQRWPDHRLVIVLDGLDEADAYSSSRRNILTMLPGAGLPGNVRFLLSSRPGEHLTHDFLGQARSFWLSEDETGQRDDRTLDDARDYLTRLAAGGQLDGLLAGRGIAPETLVSKVARASQGNFLYLHHYAQGLKEGYQNLLDLDELPHTLNGIYRDFLGAIKSRREDVSWDGSYKPVLGVLAAAREPLTRRQVADFSDVRPGTVGTILTHVKQFLDPTTPRADGRYALYHSSFGEYLLSEENEDYIDGGEVHAGIVEYYRRRCAGDWPALAHEGYLRRQLATHLAGASLDEELWALISRAWWLARTEGDGYTQNGFLADIESAWGGCLDRGAGRLPVLVKLETARRIVGHQVSSYSDTALQALVWLRREREALSHARLRELPYGRFRGLVSVFEALRERGQPDVALLGEAVGAADRIEDQSGRAHAVSRVVVEFASGGHCERAAQAAEHIGVERYKVQALLQAAAGCGEPGSAGRANLLMRAWETARAMNREWPVSAESLATVINAMVELGVEVPSDGADGMLTGLSSIGWTSRHDAEKAVAEALTRLGAHAAVASLISGIRDPWSRSQIAHRVALIRRTAEDGPEAAVLFDQALAHARSVSTGSSRDMAMRDAAVAICQAGFPEKAAAAIDEIQDPSYREEGLVALATALAEAGQSDEAARTAAAVSNELWRGNAYSRLVDALIGQRRFAAAAETARAIPRPEPRAGAFLRLALAAAEDPAAGLDDQFGLAIDAARAIDGPYPISVHRDRAWAQIQVASALAAHGDSRASDVFREAAETAWGNPDEEYGAASIRDLAVALCKAGDCDGALELARNVDYPEFRSVVLADLTVAIAAAGHHGQAAEAARSIPDVGHRAESLGRLALDMARDGCQDASAVLDEAIATAAGVKDPESWVATLRLIALAIGQTDSGIAGTLLDEAMLACGEIEDPERRARFLHGLAQAFAQIGSGDQAVRLARALSDDWMPYQALSDVTIVLVRAGHLGPALDVSRTIDDRSYRDAVLPAIASALREKGDLARAAEVASRIPDGFHRRFELKMLVTELVRAGEYEQAERIARTIDESHRGQAVRDLAKVYASSGQVANAVRVVNGLAKGQDRDKGRVEILKGLIEAGDFDEADRFARQVGDTELRRWAVRDLAIGLAQAEEFERAISTARSIPDDAAQASAMAGIAVALAGSGDPRADAYFDQALAGMRASGSPGDWSLKNLALDRARLALLTGQRKSSRR